MKTYTDKDGNEILAKYIDKLDLEKHSVATKLCKKAEDINERLAAFKNELFQICDALYRKALDENKVVLKKNSVGGYSIMTIDKAIKIEVTISETIFFDDNITIAQLKIEQYLKEKTQGVDSEIQILIDDAFKTRKGKLDTKRVLGLLKLKINHPIWKEAMVLIEKSIQTNNTKRYARIWKKNPSSQGYEIVNLDFASI